MYSQVKKTTIRSCTVLAISLLCTAAAQANVYERPRTKPGVLMEANTPGPLAHLRTAAPYGAESLAWLSPAPLSTTLRLTRTGLPPLPEPIGNMPAAEAQERYRATLDEAAMTA